MAEAKTTTYSTLEAAKAACEAENKACKEKGEGKERFVFDITVAGEHKFYVVATLSGKARAIAALALDIKANVAEKKAPQPAKSLVEQVTTASPSEIQKIRELLAQLEAGEKREEPQGEPDGTGNLELADPEPGEQKPKRKGKKSSE